MIQSQILASLDTGKQNTADGAVAHMTKSVHWTHYSSQPRPGAKTLVMVHGACHNEVVWSLGPDNWVFYFTRLGYNVATLSLPGHKPSKGMVRLRSVEDFLQ